jgi:hypothetical protein
VVAPRVQHNSHRLDDGVGDDDDDELQMSLRKVWWNNHCSLMSRQTWIGQQGKPCVHTSHTSARHNPIARSNLNHRRLQR